MVFKKINLKFATDVDLKKIFKQIKFIISLYSCAPCSECPSNVSTMKRGGFETDLFGFCPSFCPLHRALRQYTKHDTYNRL